MREYTVTWIIDVPADSPRDAALFARECMERPETTAVVFMVTDQITGMTTKVDLLEETL